MRLIGGSLWVLESRGRTELKSGEENKPRTHEEVELVGLDTLICLVRKPSGAVLSSQVGGLVLGSNKAFHHDFKLSTYHPQIREEVYPLPKQ